MKPTATTAQHRQFRIREEVDVFLMKIFLPLDGRNDDEAPVSGLPEIRRDSPQQEDFNRRMNSAVMGNPHDRRSEVGRVRKGRVDTGFPFLGKGGQKSVGGGFLLPALLQSGEWIPSQEDSHWYLNQNGGNQQQVVVIPLIRQKRGMKRTLPLGASVVEEVQNLLGNYHFICHGWLNPKGKPSTLNLVYPQKGEAEYAVQIKDGKIGLVSYDEMG